MYLESCKKQRTFNEQMGQDRQNEEKVQELIVKEIQYQGKPFEELISLFSNHYSKLLAAVVLLVAELFHKDIQMLGRILITTFILTILVWLFGNFFKLAWEEYYTDNEILKKISKIFDRNKLIK